MGVTLPNVKAGDEYRRLASIFGGVGETGASVQDSVVVGSVGSVSMAAALPVADSRPMAVIMGDR